MGQPVCAGSWAAVRVLSAPSRARNAYAVRAAEIALTH
jgi:hypothetical protein